MAEWTMQSITVAIGVFITVIALTVGILTQFIDIGNVPIDNNVKNLSSLNNNYVDYEKQIELQENSTSGIVVSSSDDESVAEAKGGLDQAYESKTTFKKIMQDIPVILDFLPKQIFDLAKWIIFIFITTLAIIMLWRYDGGVLR